MEEAWVNLGTEKLTCIACLYCRYVAKQHTSKNAVVFNAESRCSNQDMSQASNTLKLPSSTEQACSPHCQQLQRSASRRSQQHCVTAGLACLHRKQLSPGTKHNDDSAL